MLAICASVCVKSCSVFSPPIAFLSTLRLPTSDMMGVNEAAFNASQKHSIPSSIAQSTHTIIHVWGGSETWQRNKKKRCRYQDTTKPLRKENFLCFSFLTSPLTFMWFALLQNKHTRAHYFRCWHTWRFSLSMASILKIFPSKLQLFTRTAQRWYYWISIFLHSVAISHPKGNIELQQRRPRGEKYLLI